MYESMVTVTEKGWERIAIQRCGVVQGIHKLVWSLFGDRGSRKRDFIYMVDETEGGATKVFIRSHRKPVVNDYFDFTFIEEVDFRFEKGEVVGFLCDFNFVKTKTIKKVGKDDTKIVVDLYQDELITNKEGPRSPHDLAVDYWKRRSAQRGFDLLNLELLDYRKYDMPKSGRKASIVRVLGDMEVTDPEKFTHMITNGIGKMKSKGCGLMLVHGANR